jgi:TPR repeat protein/uncharacterized membrane protein YgcG
MGWVNGVMSSDRGGQPRSGDRGGGVNNKTSFFARAARSLAVALALASLIVLCFDSSTQLFADYADGYRTEQSSLPDAVNVWRKDAWRLDDYFAQVRLGDLYSQNQSFAPKESSKNPSFFDPVEAYVWYFMALRPDHRYSFHDNSTADQNIGSIQAGALTNARQVFHSLTFEQRLDARARLIYILSSRGAEGFMTLGRLHGVGIPPEVTIEHDDRQIVLCMDSFWSKWKVADFFYWLFSMVTPYDYPHPPIWSQVDNTRENLRRSYPDSFCRGRLGPKPPVQSTGGLNSPGAYSGNAPVALNGGGGSGSPLPVSSPGVGADPRSSLQADPSGGGGDSEAIPLVTPGAGADSSGAPPGESSGGNPDESGDADSGGSPDASPVGSSGGNGGSYGGGGNYHRVPSVFVRSWTEALTYFRRADMLGHPMADSYTASLRYGINTLNPEDGKRIIADAEKRALYWAPPYEFYQGTTTGGFPHSDESLPSLEQRIALGRVGEIPCCAIAEALDFRRYTVRGRACGPPPFCLRKSILAFQNALGYEPTGFLTPPQVVRLIQMAAVDGDAVAQDRLGIMYAKGIGVPQNFVRAEKWFINAANQHNADALFNLYVLYKVGPNGIEQDEHKAASYYLQAMAARYNVLLCELRDLLRQADDRHDHPDGARRRS